MGGLEPEPAFDTAYQRKLDALAEMFRREIAEALKNHREDDHRERNVPVLLLAGSIGGSTVHGGDAALYNKSNINGERERVLLANQSQ